MSKQVGKDGLIKCPDCGFESIAEEYDPAKDTSFRFTCKVCGSNFRLRYETIKISYNAIYLVEEKDG